MNRPADTVASTLARFGKLAAFAALSGGCGGGPPVRVDPPAPTDSGVEVPTEVDGVRATCAPDPANALRARCTVEVDPPAAVEIGFAPSDGGLERVHVSEQVAGEHEIPLYLMASEARYSWTARRQGASDGVTGVLDTARVPDAFALDVTVTGAATFPYLLMPGVCTGTANAIIVRTSDGEVVWYEDLAPGEVTTLSVAQWTDEGTVLGLTSLGQIVETTLTSERGTELRRTVDFDEMVHHDVWQRDGLTYALFNDSVMVGTTEYLVDGFVVFDRDGEQAARWWLADHVELPTDGLPGEQLDWSHANSVWTDETGDIYLSLRHLSAALKLEGDLSSPDFGRVIWQLVGDSASDLTSDFALSPSETRWPDFGEQHNLHVLPNGRLAMFDNRKDLHEPSRVVQIALDETAKTAEVVAAYEVGDHCEAHGGSWHTVAGNPVATCGPSSLVQEFDLEAATGAPRWTAKMRCPGHPGSRSIFRAVPLEGI